MQTKPTYRIQLTTDSDVLVLSADIEGKRVNLQSMAAFMGFLRNAIERGESIQITSTLNKAA